MILINKKESRISLLREININSLLLTASHIGLADHNRISESTFETLTKKKNMLDVSSIYFLPNFTQETKKMAV